MLTSCKTVETYHRDIYLYQIPDIYLLDPPLISSAIPEGDKYPRSCEPLFKSLDNSQKDVYACLKKLKDLRKHVETEPKKLTDQQPAKLVKRECSIIFYSYDCLKETESKLAH